MKVKYKAGLKRPPRKPAAQQDPPSSPSLPSTVARRLALAYHIDRLIEQGKLRDYAEAADVLGVSRARVSQLMDLVLLPIAVQEELLTGVVDSTERELRRV